MKIDYDKLLTTAERVHIRILQVLNVFLTIALWFLVLGGGFVIYSWFHSGFRISNVVLTILLFLIYFLFWYLESMKSFEAFRDCYDYIQNEVEKEFRMLSYGKDFFFQGDLWAWYKEVREISVAEYLFRRRR